jgi:hypothetical protein
MNYVPPLARKTFISVVRGFYTKPIAQSRVLDVSKYHSEYHSVCTADFVGKTDA